MFNQDLATIFEEMGDMEEIEGNRWESLAYRKVAESILSLGEDVRELAKRGELKSIDGVGEKSEKKILQYINEGKITHYENLKGRYPIDFASLRRIQGLGPKRIHILFKELGVKSVEDLETSIKEGSIAKLSGFGQKSQDNLKKGVEVFKQGYSGRILLGRAYDEITHIRDSLHDSGLFTRVVIAGSFRRMKETIGDADILAVSEDRRKAADYFVSMEGVVGTVVKGESKVTVNLKMGITCDLRFIDANSFGAALQYFTGSKDHNVRLRDLAIGKQMKLNEYGLYSGDRNVASKEEEQIYQSLGLQYVQPELRENSGEIEAAVRGSLPVLVNYNEVRSDFHTHTSESDGKNTLEEMVSAAIARRFEYIAITDHSKSLKVANGLDELRFSKLHQEIDRVAEETGFKILKGVELEILKDGSLDLSNEMLDQMDFVLASLHQQVSTDRNANTKRVVTALRSGKVDALAHPTGRMIGSREPYSLDMEAIFQECADNKVFLEINGYPERSDLPSDLVKRARTFGVKFTLASDSHNRNDLRNLTFATAIARRGWLTSGDILNTKSFEEVKKLLS